jgi:PAS domain S-box-containing protein
VGRQVPFDDIYAVMAAASIGQVAARVAVPAGPQPEDPGTRLGIALNVLLDELSARARAADEAASRLRLLTAAAREFAEATQEPERLLSTVAQRLAEVVKDQCVVRLVSADGRMLDPVAVYGADEEAERVLREMYATPLPLENYPAARQVHETGEPFVVPKVDLEAMRDRTTPQVLEWARRIGIHSLLILPLRQRGVSFGQLVLTRYRPDSPPFDEQDVSFAGALADHAAIAIANSRSYAAERIARAAAERATRELRESEARYRLMFDHSPLPKWMYDAKTLQFVDVNATAVQEYGFTREEFLAMTIRDLRPPEDVPALLEAERAEEAENFSVCRLRKQNGEIITVEITKHTVQVGDRTCRLAVGKDVTERLRLEDQLRQAQKMDAIGRLAGGIAHDFNNMLSVILSYADMLLGDLKPEDPIRDDIEEIRKAGKRGGELTRQLLMFSRQQLIEPKVLDLNDVLGGMDKLLQRILGADVDLVSLPTRPLGRVRIDRGSIEQVILNLVVNARDAMPTGGKLTMETADVVLDAEYARNHHGVVPGPHVMLAVSDNGVGMDRATLERIFEPFFTTKANGKGTGLGLSTVFGIVRQGGGSVWVYSEPGKGTTFKVYLPRIDAELDAPRPIVPPTKLRGSETILLVEDDDQVRAVALGILRRNGYQVIEARHAGEALLHSEKASGAIDLLLTDVVMPQMSGPELAKRLASVRPGMKVLCMSGYTDDSIVRHGVLESHLAYVQKPITPEGLTSRVREVLDAGVGGHRG